MIIVTINKPMHVIITIVVLYKLRGVDNIGDIIMVVLVNGSGGDNSSNAKMLMD